MALEHRQYKILGVLGVGGFGKVYRARLESGDGFSKDVALKLMKDDDVPESVLKRFRDEARILGLIRDRAIVAVDPPTRIAGKWAVVMEFVDGASCHRIGKKNGRFPVGVAVEIVGEVARALDKVWNQQGPDGRPLRLLHRDIKPGNIQVTPAGEVKLLDFGIARGDFDARETKTTAHIGGTPGFIAPERLYDEEGPKSDIFSLGVVLHMLLKGSKPPRCWVSDGDDGDPDKPILEAKDDAEREALLLCREMVHPSPAKRLASRDVERRCARIRSMSNDPLLRDWAEDTIPMLSELAPDEMVGETFSETLTAQVSPLSLSDITEPTDSFPVSKSMAVAVGGTSLIAVAVAGVMLIAGIGIIVATQSGGDEVVQTAAEDEPPPPPDEPPPPEAKAPSDDATADAEEPEEPDEAPVEQPADPEATDGAGTDEAAPVEATAATPTEPPPEPKKTQTTSASSGGTAQNTTTNTRPAATTTEPAGPTYPVTISSIPMGAEVWIDGSKAGNAPLMGHALVGGSHELKLVSGDKSISKTIRVGRRSPSRYVWKAASGEWESGM